ncbi:hypothetical protein H1235_08820 [Pseudoxanthomonas sp. NC8]|nr:hypothetical protein H1235_08820 [Pseudoxanthomonas sp. NC8]
MNEATLDALHEDLVSFHDALDRENFAHAGDLLAAHDQRLREYIDNVGQQSPLQVLRGLLQLQHRVPAGSSAS